MSSKSRIGSETNIKLQQINKDRKRQILRKFPKYFDQPSYTEGATADGQPMHKFVGPAKQPLKAGEQALRNAAKRRRRKFGA